MTKNDAEHLFSLLYQSLLVGHHIKIGPQHTETRNRVTKTIVGSMQNWVDDVKHGLGPRIGRELDMALTDEQKRLFEDSTTALLKFLKENPRADLSSTAVLEHFNRVVQ